MTNNGSGIGSDGSYFNAQTQSYSGVPYVTNDFNGPNECPKENLNIEVCRTCLYRLTRIIFILYPLKQIDKNFFLVSSPQLASLAHLQFLRSTNGRPHRREESVAGFLHESRDHNSLLI